MDSIFKKLNTDYILLVDSDSEIIDERLVREMKSYIEIKDTFGCGCIQGPCKLDLDSFYDKKTDEKGLYVERMWIPCTMLDVEKVRDAISHNKSFIDKTEYNIFPHFNRISKLLYKKFPQICNSSIMKRFKKAYVWGGGNTSNVVYYDTGAEIYEYLKNVKYWYYFGLRYESFVHEKYVKHYEGITRKLLMGDNDRTACDISDVTDMIKRRLYDEYGFEFV